MKLKFKYNSPVVLTITFICFLLFGIDWLTGNKLLPIIALPPALSLDQFYKVITYALAHGSVEHLLGNLAIFLLVGPLLEERYGPKLLLLMMFLTAIITALLNVLLFDEYLVGLSGVVFMMVILASFTNVTGEEIPLTFVFVILLFLGREVINALEEDQVSQFSHIIGGMIGSLFGFYIGRKNLLVKI